MIEPVLHVRSEIDRYERGEMLGHDIVYDIPQDGRNQLPARACDVIPLYQSTDGRRICRWSPYPRFFKEFYQGGVVVARKRRCKMLLGQKFLDLQFVTHG